MKRRTFLASLCAAMLSTKLALEFGASKPHIVTGLDIGHDGFEFTIDPDPPRFVMKDGFWIRVPNFIEVPCDLPGYETWIRNPEWHSATHEYRREWPIGGVPQPRDRVVDNPYAGYA